MKLTLNDNWEEAIKKISEGNPGALRVLIQCYQKSFLIGQFIIAELDIKEIYGSHIWELYKDKCGEDLDEFILTVDPKVQRKKETLEKVGIMEPNEK